MWFKKKSVLQDEGHYNTELSADGHTDLRTSDWAHYSNSDIKYSGLPSAADAGNSFYLPALGYYRSGKLFGVGDSGYYWSSTADSQSYLLAYNLDFSDSRVFLSDNYYFTYGFRVGGIE